MYEWLLYLLMNMLFKKKALLYNNLQQKKPFMSKLQLISN